MWEDVSKLIRKQERRFRKSWEEEQRSFRLKNITDFLCALMAPRYFPYVVENTSPGRNLICIIFRRGRGEDSTRRG